MLFPVAPALAAAVFTAELSPESGRLILEWIPMTWVVFVLWYWRVARIRRPDWVNSHGLVDSLASNPLEQLSSTEGGTPRGRASRQLLLGSESLLANIAIGAVVAIPLLIFVRSMFDKARMLDLPLLFAAPLSGVGASLGGMICRRARHLWLRAGLDRPALFRLAERAGMPVALAVFFAAAGVLLTASILARPEQAPVFVAYTAALGVLTASLFYFGLSLTRGWNAGDVLRGIGLIVLVGITDGTIKPRDGASVGILVATGLFTLLALLLRRWAMHRWRELDWRVARLPGVSRA
jgi:hypothetical protein